VKALNKKGVFVEVALLVALVGLLFAAASIPKSDTGSKITGFVVGNETLPENETIFNETAPVETPEEPPAEEEILPPAIEEPAPPAPLVSGQGDVSIMATCTNPITSCCSIDVASGVTYTLGNDINNASGHCIDFNNANGVTVDCQGHKIDGDDVGPYYGIQIRADHLAYSITIKNCTVTDFGYGIYVIGSSSHTLIDNSISSNGAGILLVSNSNNIIANNTVSSNSKGIQFSNSNSNTLTNNTVSSNSYGFYLSNSHYNTISNSTVSSNSYGIVLGISESFSYSSNYNNITSNNATGNTLWDFLTGQGSTGNTVTNLTTQKNLISFTSNDIALKGLTTEGVPANPSGYNISKYLNITSNSGSSWIYLNISYNNLTDVLPGANESLLKFYKYSTSSSSWVLANTSSSINGVDLVNKIVYANITDFGSTFAPLGGVVEGGNIISSCPYIINNPGNYTLGSNLSANGTAITINASNVVLDGQGHSIMGNGTGYGINLSGVDNVTLRNIRIGNFSIGLKITNSSYDTFDNLTFIGNTINVWLDPNNTILQNSLLAGGQYGLVLTNSNNNILRYNVFVNNTKIGVLLNGSSTNNTLLNDTVYNNMVGIKFDGSGVTLNNIINTTSSSNNDTGIYLNNSNGNILSNDAANSNGIPCSSGSCAGIYLYNSSGNSIMGSTASSNRNQGGIWLDAYSNNNNVTGNTASNPAGLYGIYINSNSVNNLLANNIANSNNQYGIHLDLSSNSNILTNNTANSNAYGIGMRRSSNSNNATNNSVSGNSNSGFYLQSASGNRFENNTANSNGGSAAGFTLFSSSSNTLTNNKAIGPSQSTGISFQSSSTGNIIINNNVSSNSVGINLPSGNNGNTIANNSANSNYNGIALSGSTGNIIANNTVNGNTNYGISLSSAADSNTITGNSAAGNGTSASYGIYFEANSKYNVVANNNFSSNQYGIYLKASGNGGPGNNFTNNTIISSSAYGIYITSYSAYNKFVGDTVQNSTQWDYYNSPVNGGDHNTVINLTTYQNVISFTEYWTAVKGLKTTGVPTDASGYKNITKYINATANAGSSWLYLNVSYNSSDIVGINENTLKIYKYNTSSSSWVLANSSGINGVDTVNKVVYANITNFGSTFAPFGTDIYEINSCPRTASSSGTYMLNSNCSVGGSDSGITISTGDVTLDCQGHSITGVGIQWGILASSGSNVVIKNCIINSFSAGIKTATTTNYTIFNNTITNMNYGIMLYAGDSNITGNTLTGTNQYPGIWIMSTNNNKIFDNSVSGFDEGILLDGGDFPAVCNSNTLANNKITATGSSKAVRLFGSSANNVFTNTSINSAASYIITSTGTGNNFTNTTFNRPDASARFIPTVTVAANRNINQTNLNITSNRIFLNSTALPEFNTSAEITLRNLAFANALPVWDPEDDGTFVICPSDMCSNISYVGGVGGNLTFTAAHFTSYSGGGNVSSCGSIDGTGQYYLTQNITSGGTCITINNNNIMFDCQGYTIDGDDSGYDHGVYDYGYDNITIKNCIVTDFANGICFAYGADNGAIVNNTLNSNTNDGIYAYQNSNNVAIINNTAISNSGNGISIDYNDNNTLMGNLVSLSTFNGVLIDGSTNNTLANNNVSSNTLIGIILFGPNANGNIIINNTANSNTRGIWLTTNSNNNIFTNNTAQNNGWDFGSQFNSLNNTVTNLNTTAGNLVSFLSKDITLTGLATAGAPANKASYYNISKYLSITNNSATSWIYLNASYNDSDVPAGVANSTLKIWKYNASGWIQVPGTNGVDLVNKFVYANISDFGSTFAPLGFEATEISSCPGAISTSGNYVLSNNLSYASGNVYCIYLAYASNVQIDCQGHTITCTDGCAYGGSAILNNGWDNQGKNVTIKNCKIINPYAGIYYYQGAANGLIINNEISGAYGGIVLGSDGTSSNITVANNTLLNSRTFGVFGRDASNNRIENNKIVNTSSYGIAFDTFGSNLNQNNIFIGNTIINSTLADIYTYNGIASNDVFINNILNNSLTASNISFTGDNINLIATKVLPADQPSYINILHYVDITNLTAAGWIYLNVSYNNNTDLPTGINESILKIYKYNTSSSSWALANTSSGINGVDLVNKVVYANITDFGSTFAPLGQSGLSCGDTITTSTNLTQNISSNSGTCVIIGANNVVLDCQGYGINGNLTMHSDTAFGIDNTGGYENVTVENCIITDWDNGIYFSNGANNSLIYNNTVNLNSNYGILFYSGSNNNFINNTANSNGVTGIALAAVSGTNNNFTGNTANSNGWYGIDLGFVSHYILTSNNANNNSHLGIRLLGSSNNLLTSNSAQNNSVWDFESKRSPLPPNDPSLNNTISNLNTTGGNLVSFLSKDISLKGLLPEEAPAPDPFGYKNITHYINETNNSADSWLFINISYNSADAAGIDENTLRIWKKSESDPWTNESFYDAGNYGVDTVNDFVYANITDFGSTFAPLGQTAPVLDNPPNASLISPSNGASINAPVTFTANVSDDFGIANASLWSNISGTWQLTDSWLYSGNIVPDSSTVGLWHFDEGAGNTAADSSGLGNNGSLMGDLNTTGWTSQSRLGSYALSFNGVNDSVWIGKKLIGDNNSYTLEAWANPGNVTGLHKILEDGWRGGEGVDNFGYVLGIENSKVIFYSVGSDMNTDIIYSAPSLTPNQWYHIAAVRNLSVGAGTLSIYINGQLDQTVLANYQGFLDKDVLSIGGYYNPAPAYSDYFNGTIDEVAIYNRSLSASEIKQLYQRKNPATSDSANWTIDSIPAGAYNWNVQAFDSADQSSWSAANWTFTTQGGISSCAYISRPGSYTLTQNISSSGTCITIGADNVTLDCKGYSITGDTTGNGISNTGFHNGVVKNCVITNFTYAIYFYGANNAIIDNNTANSNYYGIYFYSGSNNTFTGNTANNNFQAGISITESSGNILTSNIVSSNTRFGFSIMLVNNSIIYNNTIENNGIVGQGGRDGISVQVENHGNNITFNSITNSGRAGIFLRLNSSDNIIANNSITNSHAYGILVTDSSSNSIANNTIANVSTNGLAYSGLGKGRGVFIADLYGADSSGDGPESNNIVSENKIYDCQTGLHLRTGLSTNNVLKNNVVYRCNNGIYINDGNDNVITDNVVNATYHGVQIYFSANNTLSGNNITRAIPPAIGLYVWSDAGLADWQHNITETNTINGIPIQYYDGIYRAYPDNQILNYTAASHISFIGCNNVTLENSSLIDTLALAYTSNSTIRDITVQDAFVGVDLTDSSENTIRNVISNSNSGSGAGFSLEFGSVGSNNNILINVTANSNGVGIYASTCSNNIVVNSTAQNNLVSDFYSDLGSLDNIVTNVNVTGGNLVSFTSKDILLKGLLPEEAPASDPLGYKNITHYINATNNSGDSWLFINISYNISDVPVGVDESTLRIWKYNTTILNWQLADGTGINGVDTTNKFVFANITEFGSTFAPFGTNVSNATGLLVCIVNETCPVNYTDVLRISNLTNAHAELFNETNYDYKVCCKDNNGVASIGTNSTGTQFLKLSNSTNAHVELPSESNYNYPAYISASPGGVSCSYPTDPENCTGNQTCLASISGTTNAHIADCTTDPYSTKICCELVQNVISICPYVINSSNIYILNQSINTTGTCITINASDVTLDCAGNIITGDGTGIGIESAGFNNSLVQNCIITNFSTGILFADNNFGTITNNIVNFTTDGLFINNSANNTIDYNDLNSNYNGIYIQSIGSTGNIVSNNNINSNFNYGIYLITSSNNSFISNTVQDDAQEDFFSEGDSLDNEFVNLTTQQNLISFTSKDIALKGLTTAQAPPTEPSNYYNISKYINATNNSANSWLYINISYNESDIPSGVDKNTLRMWKYNETSGNWTNSTAVFNVNGVDTANNFVYANISEFGSTFAPFAIENVTPVVDLILPANNTLETATNSIIFAYNATNSGSGIANCSLILNGVINQTNTTITETVPQNFTAFLANGQYNWSINCTDSVGNEGASETRNLTVDVIACPYTISSPGTYNLTQNISSSGTCITINASDVTLDCNGYAMTGDSWGSGIYSESVTNITVRNCSIGNFSNGIYLQNASFSTIANNTVYNNSMRGIALYLSSNNSIENNTAHSNTPLGLGPCMASISLRNSSENNIASNSVYNTPGNIGVYICQDSDSNRIFLNNITDHWYNIVVEDLSDNNILIENYANNGIAGDVYVYNSFGNMNINLTTAQNKISFTGNNFELKGLTPSQAPADPAGYKNITKYINATNNSADSWLFINISYNNTDIPVGANENNLKIMKYSGVSWTIADGAGINGVDTTNKFVYANITNFSSTFAPLADVQAPSWSGNKTYPASPAIYSPTASYQFNITWTDNAAVDTVLFEHNFTTPSQNYSGTGNLSNESYYNYNTPLAAGSYYWKSWANDSSGNLNFTDVFNYQVDKAVPSCSLTFDPVSGPIYPGPVNASCSCTNPEATANLYRDTINVTATENNIFTPLAAGPYNYVCNASATENYTTASNSSSYQINQSASTLTLNIAPSLSENYSTTTTANCTSSTSQITPELYRNGTFVPGAYESLALAAGSYNYSCNATETQNYTAPAEQSDILTINKTTPTCSLSFDPAGSTTYNNSVNASCSCDNPETTAKLYRNNTDVTGTENNQFALLGANTYNYVCNATESQNYTNASASASYTINPIAPVLTLSASPGWTVKVGTQSNISCVADTAQVTPLLFRNDTGSASNPDVQTLALGYYNYSCNNTATQNYTTATASDILLVSPLDVANCSLSFSPASGGTWPVSVNASCSCDNPETTTSLWRNGTNVTAAENNVFTQIPAGSWDYVCNSSETQNFTYAEDTSAYLVNKAATAMNLLLNSNDASIIRVNATVNITATLSPAVGTITLYEDGLSFASGSSPLNNIRTFAGLGNYNITAEYAGNENYSSSYKTHFASIVRGANYTNFNGSTTNFNNASDITNVCQPVLEKLTKGIIKWSLCVNASGADFDKYVSISQSLISVNISGLNPSFNSSANITLYNINFITPKIEVDYADNGTFVNCTDCTTLEYAAANTPRNLTFNISHFTTFRAVETPVPSGGGSTHQGCVEKNPPAVVFVAPTPASASTINATEVEIWAQATDESGIANAILEFDNFKKSMKLEGDKWFVKIDRLEEGAHSYSIFSDDKCGNRGYSESRTLTIQTVAAPVVEKPAPVVEVPLPEGVLPEKAPAKVNICAMLPVIAYSITVLIALSLVMFVVFTYGLHKEHRKGWLYLAYSLVIFDVIVLTYHWLSCRELLIPAYVIVVIVSFLPVLSAMLPPKKPVEMLLRQAVKKNFRLGFSERMVKESLEARGWPKQIVNKVVREARRELIRENGTR